MSDSKEILKQKFIEHFLFDYTDKDEYEVRMLSEIFEGIYYQKDKHFKPESKYWQVFCCLTDQQAIIDDLRAQLNSMERCYIEKKKQVEACAALVSGWREKPMGGWSDYARGGLHSRQDCTDDLEKALRGEQPKTKCGNLFCNEPSTELLCPKCKRNVRGES